MRCQTLDWENDKLKDKNIAVLLAGGSGKRMGTAVAKQYMLLNEKPVIWYGLQAFEQSPIIDEVILVTGSEDIADVQQNIVNKYGFSKVKAVIGGGKERYFSVYNALSAIVAQEDWISIENSYVFIHDGARPLLSQQIINDTYKAAVAHKACCAAVPVKDTIKIANKDGFAAETLDRSSLYTIQTPQAFQMKLIWEAYEMLVSKLPEVEQKGITITDDAMVVETMLDFPVKLVPSSYKNIKITTPEDMEVALGFLRPV